MSPRRIIIGALLPVVLLFALACEDSGNESGEGQNGAGVVGSVDETHGLKGTYFNNKDFTDQALQRVDHVVDFDWGRGSPDSRVDANTFSVRWTGFLEVKFSETYTFYTVGDDGIRLYIDDQLVVNDWSDHGARERSGTIALKADRLYPIKLEYYESGGGAVAKLLWSSANQQKQVIPEEWIFAELPSDGPIITASGENAKYGEVKENAFDGNAKTKWLTFADSAWIQYDFAGDASKVITQYSITSANDAQERDPKNWRLLGSNDGSQFTTVDERSAEKFSSRFQTRTFYVEKPGTFKMYRLDISSNYDPPSANSTQLAEIEFTEGDIPGDELCAEADENKTVTLSCPDGEKITNILFASYGLPEGSCEDGLSVGTCHALLSETKVEDACLDQTTCTVAASNGVFGDPCAGKYKRLAVEYTCSGGGVVDQCPNDPNKTEPGECGCGVPEGTCGACASTLSGNESVDRGELLCSPNGQYRFGLDDGGDLVLLAGSEVLWSAGLCCDAGFLAMQGSDGNLVVYTDDKAPRWASRTAGNPGAVLYVEDDGRAVIRIGSRELWSVGGVDEDLCPNDPNKTVPGECGCGVPEGTCGGDEVWKFVVVGDSRGSDNGVNTAAWGHLVSAIVKEGAEFVLFPGDLTSSGSSTQFAQWKKTTKPLYDAKIGVYAVRGNHDDNSLSAWNNAFSGSYSFPQNGPSGEKNLTYSFTHKNVFVAAIDNYSSSTGINQSWLDVQLAQNTQPHVFVFGHEPAFAASHQDCLDDNATARNRFWQSIEDAGGRAYFSGHDHFYDHSRISDNDGNQDNDVHQFIVGTAGAPMYDFGGNYSGNNGSYNPVQKYFSDQYGYIVVEVDDMDVRMTFKQRSGSSYVVRDTFSYSLDGGGGSTGGGSDPQNLVLKPEADTYVDSANAGSNFGSKGTLLVDNDPDVYETMLRFNVPALTDELKSATLRLYVTNPTGDGPKVYLTDNDWSEGGVNYNNRPGAVGGALDDLGNIQNGWVELDVTDAIRGSGEYSFLLLPDDTNGADFDSREGTNKPQLVVVTGTGGSTDLCPNDPNKTEPGECGCGVPEGTCGGGGGEPASNLQVKLSGVWKGVCCNRGELEVSSAGCDWEEHGRVLDTTDVGTGANTELRCPENNQNPADCDCHVPGERMHGISANGSVAVANSLRLPDGAPIFPNSGHETCIDLVDGELQSRWTTDSCPDWRLLDFY